MLSVIAAALIACARMPGEIIGRDVAADLLASSPRAGHFTCRVADKRRTRINLATSWRTLAANKTPRVQPEKRSATMLAETGRDGSR